MTNHNYEQCETCNQSSYIHRAPINKSFKSVIPKKDSTCSTEWIDSKMLGYRFGTDYCNGMRRVRFFPTWLLAECIEDTKPGDLGFPDTCEPNTYYQIRNGLVYRVEYDCNGKVVSDEYIKPAKIQKCSIESIHGSQIEDACAIFKGSSLVTPIIKYQVDVNGIKGTNPNLQFLDITLTDNCELKAVYDSSLARKAVLPALGCLVKYDIPSDTATVSLGGLIDNETIRLKQKTGPCDTIYSVTYAQDNIIGDGTPLNPLIAKVKTDGTTIVGDGTSINPLRALPSGSTVYVDPTQFSGDGKSQSTQFSIRPCAISNTIFTGFSSYVHFQEPLKNGYIVTDSAPGQASKAIRSTGLSWNITNLPTPCPGKRLLGEIKIRIKSAINITSFPVHLFGDITVSNGTWLYPDAVQPLPQVQVTSGIDAEYGDSRGYCADISYLVYLNGGNATFNIKPAVIFPNSKNPTNDKPTNLLYPAGVPQDVWFESVSAQFLIHHVE